MKITKKSEEDRVKEVLTYAKWNDDIVNDVMSNFSNSMDVLKWAYEVYKDDIVYACSFGAEGIVLIDLISKITPDAKIIFLDTELHFNETYSVIKRTKQKYPKLNIKLIKPELDLTEQEKQYGDGLWNTNPNLCCRLRKIIPLESQIRPVKAWISGLRSEQSPTRSHLSYINKDKTFNKIKICPLIDWTWVEIWNYIHLNNLPYNELHDKSYPSIGCSKCTLPVENPLDLRSGRWSKNIKTECGLHQ